MERRGDAMAGMTINRTGLKISRWRRRPVALFLAITAHMVVSAGVATAATGDLTFEDCITGASAPNTGTGACAAIPSVQSPGGQNSGLDTPEQSAVSPDGTSLYVVATLDDAISHFERDPATGALTYVGCITGERESGPDGTGACTAIPTTPTTDISGVNSGMDSPVALAVSPDGGSVYVAAAGDDAVVTFDRDSATGALTYVGCITGEGVPQGGSAVCAPIPSAGGNGNNRGLDGPQSLAVSPDGAWVYVVARTDHTIMTFHREAETGALTFADCLTASTSNIACPKIPTATLGASNSGMLLPVALAISQNGGSVYVTAWGDDSVVRFDRNTETGTLTYAGCITGETQSGPGGSGACAAIPSASVDGINSGLDEPEINSAQSVAVSPDGASVYVTSRVDHAVARFDRDTDTGALTYAGCITGETQTGPAGSGACEAIASARSGGAGSGLGFAQAVAVSPDDMSVYVASLDDSIARFDRDPATGALAYAGCLTGNTSNGPTGNGSCATIPTATTGGHASGLIDPQSLALSPNGASLYALSGPTDAVARFAREPDTVHDGDLIVTNCDDPYLAQVTEITGDLIIEGLDCDVAIALPELVRVGGSVRVVGNDLPEVDLGGVTTIVATEILIEDNTVIHVDLGGVTTIVATEILIEDNTATTVDLGSVTAIEGDLIAVNNDDATKVELRSLETVGCDLTLETSQTSLDLGALRSVGCDMTVTAHGAESETTGEASTPQTSTLLAANVASTGVSVDLHSLATVGCDLKISADTAALELGALQSVGCDMALDARNADTIAATTANGRTDLKVDGGTAQMHVLLPEGTFDEPVGFVIERIGDDPEEAGTDARGGPVGIDPVGGYRFIFDDETLLQKTRHDFAIDLSKVDPQTRDALLAGAEDGNATVAVKGDAQGDAYQAFAHCGEGQTPDAHDCVIVEVLDANGDPVTADTAPAFVRFTGAAEHYSTYAIALLFDRTPADTTITAGPSGTYEPGVTNDQTPTFEFASNEEGSSFQCRIDGGAWAACTSPHTTASLADGAHVFEVRATDKAGNTDPSPASANFRVQPTCSIFGIDALGTRICLLPEYAKN